MDRRQNNIDNSNPVYATLANGTEEDTDTIHVLSSESEVEADVHQVDEVHQEEPSQEQQPLRASTPTVSTSPTFVEKYGVTTPSMEQTRVSTSPLFHQQHGAQE